MIVDMRNVFSDIEKSRESLDIPYWVPTGSAWRNMPEEIRRAIPQVLAPAYRQFVSEASGELERTIGLTLVHLIWLEVCGQVHLAVTAADPTALTAVLQKPEEMIARHLELVMAKCQAAELLVKMRLVSQSLQRPASALPMLPPPSSTDMGEVESAEWRVERGELSAAGASSSPIPPPEAVKLETERIVDQHP